MVFGAQPGKSPIQEKMDELIEQMKLMNERMSKMDEKLFPVLIRFYDKLFFTNTCSKLFPVLSKTTETYLFRMKSINWSSIFCLL